MTVGSAQNAWRECLRRSWKQSWPDCRPKNAVSDCRRIALTGADHPVLVTGNAAAIADALRNLIENSLVHTAPGTEVIVEVDREGMLSVLDNGPGIRVEDRLHIFERFCIGK